MGDNLGTAVKMRTGVGAAIDGGVRDLQGLRRMHDVNFFRATDPTPIAAAPRQLHRRIKHHSRIDMSGHVMSLVVE